MGREPDAGCRDRALLVIAAPSSRRPRALIGEQACPSSWRRQAYSVERYRNLAGTLDSIPRPFESPPKRRSYRWAACGGRTTTVAMTLRTITALLLVARCDGGRRTSPRPTPRPSRSRAAQAVQAPSATASRTCRRRADPGEQLHREPADGDPDQRPQPLGFARSSTAMGATTSSRTIFPERQGRHPAHAPRVREPLRRTFADVSVARVCATAGGFFAFADVDNDGDQDCFAGLDIPLPGLTSSLWLNDGTGSSRARRRAASRAPRTGPLRSAVFADFDATRSSICSLGTGRPATTRSTICSSGTATARSPRRARASVATSRTRRTAASRATTTTMEISTSSSRSTASRRAARRTSSIATTVTARSPTSRSPPGSRAADRQLLDRGDRHGTHARAGQAPGTYIRLERVWPRLRGRGCRRRSRRRGVVDLAPRRRLQRTVSDPTCCSSMQGAAGGHTFTNAWLDRGLPYNEGDVDAAMVDFDNDGRMDISLSRTDKYEGGYTTEAQRAGSG